MNLPPVFPGKRGGDRTNGQAMKKETEEIDKGIFIQHAFGYFLLSFLTTTTTIIIMSLLCHGEGRIACLLILLPPRIYLSSPTTPIHHRHRDHDHHYRHETQPPP